MPKSERPAKYSGETNARGLADDPEEWADRFELAAEVNGWDTDAANNKRLCFYLTGEASVWFDVNRHWILRPDTRWEDVRKEFLQRFRPVNFDEELEEHLRSPRQCQGESVRSYGDRYLRLHARARLGHLDRDFCRKYWIAGLVPDIRVDVVKAFPASFDEAVVAAIRVEQALIHLRRYEEQDKAIRKPSQHMGRSAAIVANIIADKVVEYKEASEKSKQKAYSGDTLLGRDECAHCHNEGHWKKDCPERKERTLEIEKNAAGPSSALASARRAKPHRMEDSSKSESVERPEAHCKRKSSSSPSIESQMPGTLVVSGRIGSTFCRNIVINPEASISLIDIEKGREAGIELKEKTKYVLQLPDGTLQKPFGETAHREVIDVEGVKAKLRMPIVEANGRYDVLLGRDWLEKVHALRDFVTDTYVIENHGTRVTLGREERKDSAQPDMSNSCEDEFDRGVIEEENSGSSSISSSSSMESTVIDSVSHVSDDMNSEDIQVKTRLAIATEICHHSSKKEEAEEFYQSVNVCEEDKAMRVDCTSLAELSNDESSLESSPYDRDMLEDSLGEQSIEEPSIELGMEKDLSVERAPESLKSICIYGNHDSLKTKDMSLEGWISQALGKKLCLVTLSLILSCGDWQWNGSLRRDIWDISVDGRGFARCGIG